jgi:hypothetical protein
MLLSLQSEDRGCLAMIAISINLSGQTSIGNNSISTEATINSVADTKIGLSKLSAHRELRLRGSELPISSALRSLASRSRRDNLDHRSEDTRDSVERGA